MDGSQGILLEQSESNLRILLFLLKNETSLTTKGIAAGAPTLSLLHEPACRRLGLRVGAAPSSSEASPLVLPFSLRAVFFGGQRWLWCGLGV